jgi:putative (di)nucleoside polyphosphate hydrolase
MELGILDLLKLILRWFFDRKARLQLAGFRPEVICLVKESDDPSRYLLIRPTIEPTIWVPPSEGIVLDETLEQASLRCLNIELGLIEANLQFRKSIWLGKRVLPEGRWDERDLQYSMRGIFSKHRMIGKAYFGAYVIAATKAKIKPNPSEVCEWKWVKKGDFLKEIGGNSLEKIDILKKLWFEYVKDEVGTEE